MAENLDSVTLDTTGKDDRLVITVDTSSSSAMENDSVSEDSDNSNSSHQSDNSLPQSISSSSSGSSTSSSSSSALFKEYQKLSKLGPAALAETIADWQSKCEVFFNGSSDESDEEKTGEPGSQSGNICPSPEDKHLENADNWTAMDETCLLLAVLDNKPAGIMKHFQMIGITSRFSELSKKVVHPDILWNKIKTLFDIDALDKLEPPPINLHDEPFKLPADIIPKAKLNRLSEFTKQDAVDYRLVQKLLTHKDKLNTKVGTGKSHEKSSKEQESNELYDSQPDQDELNTSFQTSDESSSFHSQSHTGGSDSISSESGRRLTRRSLRRVTNAYPSKEGKSESAYSLANENQDVYELNKSNSDLSGSPNNSFSDQALNDRHAQRVSEAEKHYTFSDTCEGDSLSDSSSDEKSGATKQEPVIISTYSLYKKRLEQSKNAASRKKQIRSSSFANKPVNTIDHYFSKETTSTADLNNASE